MPYGTVWSWSSGGAAMHGTPQEHSLHLTRGFTALPPFVSWPVKFPVWLEKKPSYSQLSVARRKEDTNVKGFLLFVHILQPEDPVWAAVHPACCVPARHYKLVTYEASLTTRSRAAWKAATMELSWIFSLVPEANLCLRKWRIGHDEHNGDKWLIGMSPHWYNSVTRKQM